MDYKAQLGIAAGSILLTLLAGKTFRTLVAWPISLLIRKTGNKKADILVEIAENDLGVSEEVKKLEQAEGDPNAK